MSTPDTKQYDSVPALMDDLARREIGELRAEIERLKADIHDCPTCGVACKRCRCVEAEVEKLSAERDRCIEALRGCLKWSECVVLNYIPKQMEADEDFKQAAALVAQHDANKTKESNQQEQQS